MDERSELQHVEIAVPTGRIVSIDALRGFDMFWIIGGGAAVGALAGVYEHPATQWIATQLTHVRWRGFHFEDLIMPLFLFITGVVMPLSFVRRRQRGQSRGRILGHVLVRVLVLWVLGMIKQGHLLEYDLSKLHLYSNTLQAIASGYLVTALVLLYCRRVAVHAAIWLGLLLGYWALLVWGPVSGPAGDRFGETGNFAMFIDELVLGRFRDGTTYTWVLSSMTFAATVMLGAFAGRWLMSGGRGGIKAIGLLIAGVVCLGLGWVWDGWFPIIKHIWTSSFVLFSGGLCLLLLGGFYLVIDVWGLRRWAFPFVVIGSNAILAYMLPSFVNFGWTADRFVGGLGRWLGAWTGVVHHAAALAVLWVLLYILYRHRKFVRI